MIRPMELRRFATLICCDAEWEIASPQSIRFWEPLRVDAPADAEPYCCYLDTVVFHRRGTCEELARTTHHRIGVCMGDLVLLDGHWWEVTIGRAVYRDGGWCMEWTGYRNTRLAIMANVGMHAFRDPARPDLLALH